MKNTIITGVAAIALAAPAFAGAPVTYVAPAPAPSNLGLSGDISLAYQSQYAFRGVSTLVEDNADFFDEDSDVLIAQINAQYAFTESFSLVSGFRYDSFREAATGDQEDVYAGVRWATDCYAVELGYRHLVLSGNLDPFFRSVSTDEIYAKGSIVCPWTGADVSLLWAHDLDESEGDYLELSVRKAFELTEWASIELGAGISYSFDYWGDDYSNSSDFNSWNLSLSLPLKATDYLTVTPYVAYTDGMDALDFGGGVSEDDQVLWGVQASVNF